MVVVPCLVPALPFLLQSNNKFVRFHNDGSDFIAAKFQGNAGNLPMEFFDKRRLSGKRIVYHYARLLV
jgi:hypothetical protein